LKWAISASAFLSAGCFLTNGFGITAAPSKIDKSGPMVRTILMHGVAPQCVEANLIFVVLPRALDARLKAAGARYYVRTSTSFNLGPDQILARLVTSFATQEDEIDRFARLCKADSSIL
jgi:hypothetical protein